MSRSRHTAWFTKISRTALMTCCLVGLSSQPGQTATNNSSLDLAIGVVQRFGTKPTDQMTLQATPGDRLVLNFQTNNQPQTLATSSVKLEIAMQPLAEPRVEERVVLSSHRSFESAEDSANHWRAQGIETEIAQPGNWQVWAKRDVYNSPLLRRLLLQSLQTQGFRTTYLDSKTLQQIPKVSWVVNGYRYSRETVEIRSDRNLIQVNPGKTEQSRRLYAGTLRIQPNAYGTYTLVNHVPLETYLRGVVPHEIGGAPPTAVEAQAILARTYALRNLRRFAVDAYQLCADTQCQVYEGLTGTSERADQAIAATAGKVLTYQNELVDALYSSTTGGVTAPFNDVWNGPGRPYLKAVVDSVNNVWDLSRQSLADEKNLKAFLSRSQGFNEYGWDMFRWREESSIPAMNQDLRRYLQTRQHPLAGFTTIQQVQVTQRSPAGRVLKLAVTTDRGVIELEKDDILNAFYAPTSTLFYLQPVYGEAKVLKGYIFVGGGMGHGVGLSQTGSYHLGELGWSSDRILSFYYPGTQLQSINPSIIFWRQAELPDPTSVAQTPR